MTGAIVLRRAHHETVDALRRRASLDAAFRGFAEAAARAVAAFEGLVAAIVTVARVAVRCLTFAARGRASVHVVGVLGIGPARCGYRPPPRTTLLLAVGVPPPERCRHPGCRAAWEELER